jgi:neutral ceramidase
MAMANSPENSPALSAGAALREITPPLEVGLLMSSVEGRWAKFDGIRKSLFVRTVVLEGESAGGTFQRAAIVALDLLALSGKALGAFDEFKSRIAAAAGYAVKADEIVLSCTHSHSAPESGAITELYRTPAYEAWLEYLTTQIGEAIAAASRDVAPCRVSYSTATAGGLGIHRRIKTTEGIMMSHPEPAAEIVVSRDGPVDDSVNVIAFSDSAGGLKAIIVNATCHPVYEMCIPMISPDYPGELTSLLDDRYAGAVSLFLNGAAGNINPTGVSAGPAESLRHAEILAKVVGNALDQAVVESAPYLQLGRRSCELATRLPQGRDIGVTLHAEIAAIQIGSAAMVFIPGEPFVETGLAIRKASVFECTAIVGFSEETVGYIPTDAAFAEGGYEASFGTWSMVAPGSEQRLRREALSLLENLVIGAEESPRTMVPAPHAFGATPAKAPDAETVGKTIAPTGGGGER